MAESELVGKLEDHLAGLREVLGEDSYPRQALAYLKDWSDDRRAWLRRYYTTGSDEAHYDLTPAAEGAVHWLAGLEQPQFVGAESRLRKSMLRNLSIEEYRAERDARKAETN